MSTFNPSNVWLAFDDDDDEVAYEANIVQTDSGYAVEWYHVDVGLVRSERFPAYDEAVAWLEAEDFQDFTA